MKAIASFAAAVFIIALPAAAGSNGDQSAPATDTKPVAEAPLAAAGSTVGEGAVEPGDSPLVRAAKAARAANAAKPKRNKPVKVITNEDVKKSQGKLTVLPARTGTAQTGPGENASPAASPRMLETQRDELAARNRQNKEVENLKKTAADLESALRRLEEEYYQSDDATYRDKVIRSRFNDTKKELDKSRELLDKAQRRLEEHPQKAESSNP